MLVYVTAQIVSAVINASVSKMVPLVTHNSALLVSCFVLASARQPSARRASQAACTARATSDAPSLRARQSYAP
jgi:hypothetical protein